MTDYVIPPWIVPKEESYEWLDELSSVFRPEFSPGITQRQSYGGLRLKINRMHRCRGEELSALQGTLLSSDGLFNPVYSRVHYNNLGFMANDDVTFRTGERLFNSDFAAGLSGWTSSGADLNLSLVNRALRVRRVALSVLETVRANSVIVSTDASARYIVRVFLKAGRGAINCTIRIGSTAGGSEHGASSNLTTQGMHEFSVSGAFASSPVHISIGDNVSGKVANDFYDIQYISFARCSSVNAASQTGSSIDTTLNVFSTNDAMVAGDWVVIGQELKQLTMNMTTDGSASRIGTMNFKPALFRSPDASSRIHVVNPLGRFLVSDLRIVNRFAVEADISYSLEQLYD